MKTNTYSDNKHTHKKNILCWHDSAEFDLSQNQVIFQTSIDDNITTIESCDFEEYRQNVIKKFQYILEKNELRIYLAFWTDGYAPRLKDKSQSFSYVI